MTSAARRRGRSRLGAALLVVAAFLALSATRVVVASRGELARARELEARGDVSAALVHYRRAARWYAPGSPYPADALDALARIASEREAAGDAAGALAAWRAVRGSTLAARWLRQPFEARLQAASAAIDRLQAGGEAAPSSLPIAYGPHRGWSLALLAGFLLWVGAAFRLTRVGWSDLGVADRPAIRRHVAAIVLGLASFFAGLAFA